VKKYLAVTFFHTQRIPKGDDIVSFGDYTTLSEHIHKVGMTLAL
jgi:hypothetical protein